LTCRDLDPHDQVILTPANGNHPYIHKPRAAADWGLKAVARRYSSRTIAVRAGVFALAGIGCFIAMPAAHAALTVAQTTALQTAMKSNNKTTITSEVNALATSGASVTDIATAAAQYAVTGNLGLTSLELSYVVAADTAKSPTQAAAIIGSVTQAFVASASFKSNPASVSSTLSASVSAAISGAPTQSPAIVQTVATDLVTLTGFQSAAITSADQQILVGIVQTATVADASQAAAITQDAVHAIAATGALVNTTAVTNAVTAINAVLQAGITYAPTQAATLALDAAQQITALGGAATNLADIDSALAATAAATAVSRGQSITVVGQIASSLAALTPSEAAQVFVSTVESLPTALQTTANETTIATAIDKAVPTLNVTAAIAALQADLKNPNFFTGNPTPRILNNAELTALLTLLQKEEPVSPH
jgi:hypothetical protein